VARSAGVLSEGVDSYVFLLPNLGEPLVEIAAKFPVIDVVTIDHPLLHRPLLYLNHDMVEFAVAQRPEFRYLAGVHDRDVENRGEHRTHRIQRQRHAAGPWR